MGVLSDRLDAMRIQVMSPSRSIVAELRGRSDVRVTFGYGYYEQCNERALESELAATAKLLWASRMREYYRAVSEAFDDQITGERPAIGRRDVDYRDARDALVATGTSNDGRIKLSVRGMREWSVQIANGTTAALSEAEFALRIGESATKLIADQLLQTRALRLRIYA